MASAKSIPDQTYLLQVFDYDPDSGLLRWKRRPLDHFTPPQRHSLTWNTKYAGSVAGMVGAKGYAVVKLDGQAYKVHRIIYKMMTGEEPPDTVDHEKKNKTDNRWENLRGASHAENSRNRKAHNGSATGFKGVHIREGRIVAEIRIGGRNRYLGSFNTLEEAHAAYCAAALENFGEFWSPG